jgi:predicted small lipoprotein YifL
LGRFPHDSVPPPAGSSATQRRKETALRRILTSLALVALIASVTTACSQKGPAEESLKAATTAVDAAKASAEKFVPDQYKALAASLADAKGKFDKGDYAGSIAAAKDLPTKATEVVKAATAKKDELMKTWAGMETTVAAAVAAVQEKVTALGEMKKLPKGMDAAKVTAAKDGLAELSKGWADAQAAAKGGDYMAAIDKANALKAKASELASSLGVDPAAAAAAMKK